MSDKTYTSESDPYGAARIAEGRHVPPAPVKPEPAPALSERIKDQPYQHCDKCQMGYRRVCVHHCGGHAIPHGDQNDVALLAEVKILEHEKAKLEARVKELEGQLAASKAATFPSRKF